MTAALIFIGMVGLGMFLAGAVMIAYRTLKEWRTGK